MKKMIASAVFGFILGGVNTTVVLDHTAQHIISAKNGEIAFYKSKLDQKIAFLETLFNTPISDDWKQASVTITWYSLRPEETNSDPLTAAHGPSRPMMAAITPRVVSELGLTPGDRVAVISEDGTVGAVVVYWDKMNRRYDNENRIDIVAPRWEVAKLWGTKKGVVVKL